MKSTLNFICISILALLLVSCVSQQSSQPAETEVYKKPGGPNLATAMNFPHDMSKPFELYGIALGASRASVEEMYELFGCREDIYYYRCSALLNTVGVPGVSARDTTLVYIAFHKDEAMTVHWLATTVFASNFDYSLAKLHELYGNAAGSNGFLTTWQNDSGRIEFDSLKRNNSPAGIRYVSHNYRL